MLCAARRWGLSSCATSGAAQGPSGAFWAVPCAYRVPVSASAGPPPGRQGPGGGVARACLMCWAGVGAPSGVSDALVVLYDHIYSHATLRDMCSNV